MKKLLIIALLILGANNILAENIEINIQEAVNKAYESNKLITKSELDLESSDLKVKQSYKNGLPSLNLSGAWADGESPNPFGTGYKNQLVLQQPIFQGFQIMEGIKSSKNIRTLSQLQLEVQKREVKLQVIESFLNVVRLEKQKEVLEGAVEELGINLEKLKKMQELGMVTKTDVLDLELEKLKLETNLMTVENARDIQVLDLKNKIGIKPNEEISIVMPDLTKVNVEKIDYNHDLKYTLKNNIQIQMARLGKELTKASETISRAKLLPSVAFQGTYGNQSFVPDFEDSVNPENYEWSIGINFSWNIFSFGKNINGLSIAKNDTEKARLDEELAIENIELLLKSTYLNILQLDKQILAAQNAVINSAENYRLQKKKYDNQMITSIEFLSAENNLRNSKFALIDYELQFYFNYEKYLNILD